MNTLINIVPTMLTFGGLTLVRNPGVLAQSTPVSQKCLKSHTCAVSKGLNAIPWMADPWSCKCPIESWPLCKQRVQRGCIPAFSWIRTSSLDPWGVLAAWALHHKESNHGLGKSLNEKLGFQIIS